MHIKVSGKNIDIGDSLKEFANQEVLKIIEKYLGESVDGGIYIEKDHKSFDVEAFLHLAKGFTIKTNGSSEDPYKAVSLALERLEDRIRKHKNRIKDKKRIVSWGEGLLEATHSVIERKAPQNTEHDEEHLVIAEQEKFVLTLTVSEAVMKLDLADMPVVMFKNADSGKINVVYKRTDGHIGWIDYKQ